MKEDTAGAALEELIKKEGWEVASHIVVQDDRVLSQAAFSKPAMKLVPTSYSPAAEAAFRRAM